MALALFCRRWAQRAAGLAPGAARLAGLAPEPAPGSTGQPAVWKSTSTSCVGMLAPSSGKEPAPPRHRAGVASMALRSTRRFRESLISPQAAGARSATRFAARSATRCTCPRGEVTAPRARRIPRSRSRGNPGPNPRPARTSTTSKHHTLTSTQYARARTIQFITRAPRARTRDTLSRRSRGASPSPSRQR
jgi:hypothetical protein